MRERLNLFKNKQVKGPTVVFSIERLDYKIFLATIFFILAGLLLFSLTGQRFWPVIVFAIFSSSLMLFFGRRRKESKRARRKPCRQ